MLTCQPVRSRSFRGPLSGRERGYNRVLQPEAYLVPSEVIAKLTRVDRRTSITWFSICKKEVKKYQNAWEALGPRVER